MPSFDDYFARDFIGGHELHAMFGSDVEVDLTIEQFNWRDSWEFEKKKKVPKPVVFFRELDKPVMINKNSHLNLKARFGDDYDRTADVIGQRVTLATVRAGDGSRDMDWRYLITRKPHPNQNIPITQIGVDKFMARARALSTDLDEFLEWASQNEQIPKRLWSEWSSTRRNPSEWKRPVLEYMKDFLEETEERRKVAAQNRGEDPIVTDDDIPF